MSPGCKQCHRHVFHAKGERTQLVHLKVEAHGTDYRDGHPAGDRYDLLDAGLFCSLECLVRYIGDQAARGVR